MRCCLLNNRPMSNCFKHFSPHKQSGTLLGKLMARCQDIYIHLIILERDSWLRKTDQNFCKGSGSGCTAAPLSLPCVLSNTAHLSVQWQYTKPAQINGGTDTKTVPASKTKGQCAGNTPNTSILANRVRSCEYAVSIYQYTIRCLQILQNLHNNFASIHLKFSENLRYWPCWR